MTNEFLLEDAHEREQALNPMESFIVQAPAGSGKTELLTQRFLVLLSGVKQPEEILAITFTKKSAAEMRARIIAALKNASEEPEPATAHAKKTWLLAQRAIARNDALKWNLLDNPNRLQIQTIDALNAGLTRQLPLLSHFGAPLEIAPNPSMLYREAVHEFLSHLEENVAWANAIEVLLLHMDNDLAAVETLLMNMLAKRDQWLPHIAFNAQNPELRKTLESNLALIITEALTALRRHFPQEDIAELIHLLQFSSQNLLREKPHSVIAQCSELTTLPNAASTDLPLWKGIAELLLTKDGHWRKKIDKNSGFPSPSDSKNAETKILLNNMKQQMSALLDKFSQNESLLAAFNELNALPSASYEDAQWETLNALHDVLLVAVAQLKMIFQLHGQIDYTENSLAALDALGTDDMPTDITLALDYKIHHILIDEFQDTSNSQYRLLEKLISGWESNDGRTLFVVGDPMQSIYRFREAEVGLFIRARKTGIGHLPLIPLTLSVNFRSVSGVVNWVNDNFAKILPPFEDMTSGAVSYSPSKACRPSDNNDSQVKLHPIVNGDESFQAQTIIQLIQKIKQNNPGGNIAILVRARSHLKAIIPALKSANLPYRALDIDPLSTRSVIQDLLALTRALLQPADRIAWLSVLRAPWCGLSLSDLLCIAGDKSKTILWKQLTKAEVTARLSGEGQTRLKRIIPILSIGLAERRRSALRTWIEKIWLALGGPACIDEESDLDDAHAFFNLLEKLDEAWDLPDISRLNEAVNKLYAATNNQADASLQIMTIHNAKGLEFDAVILPHLERATTGDKKQLLQWMERPRSDESSALVLAPIHAVGEETNVIYDYIKRQQNRKMQYENGRLLYVAATRAKNELHLFFNLGESDKAELKKPVTNSLLEKLWPAIHVSVTHSEKKSNPSFEQAEQTTPVAKIKRLVENWTHPNTADDGLEKIFYHNNKSGFDLPNNQPKYIGTVIHQLLQQLSQFGIDWWQQHSVQTQQQYLKNNLLRLGMQPADITVNLSIIESAIANTLNDTRGKWILQQHHEAQSELPLTGMINGKAKNLVIDRTFIDENGVRWIIDYKSSHPHGVDLKSFLLAEQTEYEQQLWEYHVALQAIDKRPIRVGLYFPLIPAWREWEFNQ